MLLAPIVLAAALGQCPDPPSRYGPPPCAAANVPGCLPGYRRTLDAWGRPVYVCDRAAYNAPAPGPSEPLPGPAPADPEARAAPAYPPAQPYAPRYQAPLGHPPPPPARLERRGLVGLVFMPGGSTVDRGDTGKAAGAVGLELRPGSGGLRLRFGYEFSRLAHAADVAVKFDFNDRGQVRPFLAAGVGAASLEQDRGWGPSASLSGGLDLYFTRDVFASIELKQRAFTRDTPDGYEFSSIHQTSLYAGIGFYF